VQTGDGMAEQNLRENPGGPPRINERNLNVESEYEYGSRAGWWRLFRLFADKKMKFTLYAVAQAVEKQPEVVKRCVDLGIDVASQYVYHFRIRGGFRLQGWSIGEKRHTSR
jgi:peptidoglycan/xylan/chitin deacetylase (PgdA/CDA1 family)